ncbi:MAG: hypothetical protein NT028_09655 [candidate division Zixibacteria bacterium]|nr:hypothetical protein [candidate division Zixibacteria bacterium]
MNQMKIMKSRLLPILAVFALTMIVALTLGACGKTTDGEGSHWVQGVISDSLTKLPIDCAWVVHQDTIEATRFYSNSLGHYQIGVPVNCGSIFAGKAGYRTKEIKLGTVNSDRTGVNIELAPLQRSLEITYGPKGD